MVENLELALSLMIVGMTTVFAILFLVVVGGKLMISWVNRFYPEIKITKEPQVGDSRTVAVIASVVDVVTQGRGVVEEIKRVE